MSRLHHQFATSSWMLPESVFIVEGSHVFVMYRLADGTEWIVDNEMSHPKLVPTDASPIQLVFLLSDSQPGQVEVQLQEGLNRLSYF